MNGKVGYLNAFLCVILALVLTAGINRFFNTSAAAPLVAGLKISYLSGTDKFSYNIPVNGEALEGIAFEVTSDKPVCSGYEFIDWKLNWSTANKVCYILGIGDVQDFSNRDNIGVVNGKWLSGKPKDNDGLKAGTEYQVSNANLQLTTEIIRADINSLYVKAVFILKGYTKDEIDYRYYLKGSIDENETYSVEEIFANIFDIDKNLAIHVEHYDGTIFEDLIKLGEKIVIEDDLTELFAVYEVELTLKKYQ